MGSGRELGKEYALRVTNWIAERDLQGDWDEYKRGGQVNRAVLRAELDFGRSVASQNPAVREALAEAEARWYGEKEETAASHEAARERAEKASAATSQALSKLQDDVARLKAENHTLRTRLAKYEVIQQVLAETGRAPRGGK